MPEKFSIRQLNRAVQGRLELYYDTRTVRIDTVDADAALRLAVSLDDVARGVPAKWTDVLHPERDFAPRFMLVRPGRLLGIHYTPIYVDAAGSTFEPPQGDDTPPSGDAGADAVSGAAPVDTPFDAADDEPEPRHERDRPDVAGDDDQMLGPSGDATTHAQDGPSPGAA